MQKLAEALREKKGDESLRSVARDLGVAPGTAEGWLKAWRRPDYPHLRPLAVYLDVPVETIIDWLLEEESDSEIARLREQIMGLWTQPRLKVA
jgi:transcriptional regulator with XRE-family HTH domain